MEFIFKQAREGDNPAPYFVELGGRRRLMILKGTSEEIESEPKALTRSVSTIESIASVLRHEEAHDPEVVSQVYVNETGIVAIIDQDDRTERVSMSFEYSSQYLELLKLKSATSQKAFVTALRSHLYGCCSYPDIVNIARKIEFNRTSDGKTSIEHGRESLGRQVEMAVRSVAGDIPEELTFRVNLFAVPSDLNTQVELKFALDIDVSNSTLMLLPTGDNETRERQRVINEIAQRVEQLVPEGTLVVSGKVG